MIDFEHLSVLTILYLPKALIGHCEENFDLNEQRNDEQVGKMHKIKMFWSLYGSLIGYLFVATIVIVISVILLKKKIGTTASKSKKETILAINTIASKSRNARFTSTKRTKDPNDPNDQQIPLGEINLLENAV